MPLITPVRCKCGLNMETHRVLPIVTDAVAVDVSMCRECDKRRCRECEQYVQNLTATRCPQGHSLRHAG